METPGTMTYESVVLGEVLCVVFLVAYLNGFYFLYSDIKKFHLNVPPCEKYYFQAGCKFR